MNRHRALIVICACVTALSVAAASSPGVSLIRNQDLKEWLTYIASDDLQGRALYSTGLGLAAAYIEDHLRTWGLKPAGDNGSYLQAVRILGVKSTSHSSVTVDVGGERRSFKDGEGITFPKNAGGKRTVTIDRVEFAGYGLDVPAANHMDYRAKNVKNAAVIWLGAQGPKGLDSSYRRSLGGRSRYATEQLGAAASIGPALAAGGGRGGGVAGAGRGAEAGARQGGQPAQAGQPGQAGQVGQAGGGGRAGGPGGAGASGGAGRGAALPAADFTTVQRLDSPIPPSVSATDSFFEFVFSHAPTTYSELKAKAAAQDTLPSFRLDGVKVTFDIDNSYEVVRTQLAQNIVALVDGSDAQLKNTFVAFGAHYDHQGYAEGELVQGADGLRRLGSVGRVTPGHEDDRIWNGADDDGSGTVAVMALARAFAEGPKPKRSLLFVWHTGEERGLLGSRYFADYPTVPMDQIVTQLNIDMIGRNRDDKVSEANTVYLVGSDRISSELHTINQAANDALDEPLTLDYEFNDPTDSEALYFRSDHYSYAAKGVPIIFFTTGLHPDYHANTDEVAKIEFDKMTRITQLIYETGVRVANLDHAPVRDNKGPRAGK